MNLQAGMDPYDIVIIGGGASGLMAAVCAGRFFAQKKQVVRIAIIERHGKIGRKLAATGNGRCNLSNREASKGKDLYYHSESPLLYQNVLERFTPVQTVDFFQSIGILCHTKENGKIYPFCEQASSVIHAFEQELALLGIETLTNREVGDITKDDGLFRITGNRKIAGKDPLKQATLEPFCLLTRKVIAATGGKASPALSSDGLGYALLEKLSHTCTPLFPAIVQMETVRDFAPLLSGMKWNAGISLMRITGHDAEKPRQEIRKIVGQETGEILFTQYGISGPPVLQLARKVNEWTDDSDPADYYAVIDFLEAYPVKELIALLTNRIREFHARPIRDFLVGILPLKFASVFIKKLFPHRENNPISTLTEQDMALLVTHLKQFPLKIKGTTGWGEAQVTAGGIRCGELDPESLESKCCKGLYITGELLDVDGDCGGFNLQFAWASGCIAGEHCAASVMDHETVEE